VLKGVKLRLKLNKDQEIVMNKHVGCCRFVYNHALADGKEYHEIYNSFLPINMLITELPALKKEFHWLKEVDSTALQQILRDQNQAFQNFFKHKSGFPKFKSKHRDRPSFRLTNTNESIRIQNQKIKLSKIGFVSITRANKQLKRLPLNYKIKSVTVSKDTDQHWYASVLLECENQAHLPKCDDMVGIDLGIKNNYKACFTQEKIYMFETIDNPKAYDAEFKKLKKLQQRLSRKVKGSKNRDKARIKLARQHFRIKSVRSNFNHQLSKFLINNFQTIIIEDLDLDEMKKNNLGRKISDLAFYQFRTFLSYKASWYGRDLVIADKWFASTKICAECGYKNMSLKLSDRQYTCPNCNQNLDRDENASKNLYQLGVCYLGSGEVYNSIEYMFQFNN
jgi:putative transposase